MVKLRLEGSCEHAVQIPAGREPVGLVLAVAIKPEAQTFPRLDTEIIPAGRDWLGQDAQFLTLLLRAIGIDTIAQAFLPPLQRDAFGAFGAGDIELCFSPTKAGRRSIRHRSGDEVNFFRL